MIAIRQEVPEHRTYWAEAEAMRRDLERVARTRFHLTADEAEDVASETIIKVAIKLREPKAIRAVAYLAMKRIIIERWRSRSCQEKAMELSEDGLWEMAATDQEIGAIELWDLAKDLPDHYIAPIWANYLGHDWVSGAEAIGVSQVTYKARLHRGRMKARELAGIGTQEAILGGHASDMVFAGVRQTREAQRGLTTETKLSEEGDK